MQLNYNQDRPVDYDLPLDNQLYRLNDYLGRSLTLRYEAAISCIHCGRETKKSFNQGYCFPCFRSLARCDMCIVKPELCHFHNNTCREPEWGQKHCMIPHTIYLANSSGLKVGVTRTHQQLTRWMDQGAIAAVPIAQTQNRLDAGKIEVQLKKSIADKTNWRLMLKGEVAELDLRAEAKLLQTKMPTKLEYEWLDQEPIEIKYPVLEYPKKITSFNLDKNPLISGRLLGMKGQYLIFDSGVINIRKYAGYRVRLED